MQNRRLCVVLRAILGLKPPCERLEMEKFEGLCRLHLHKYVCLLQSDHAWPF
jgi:hypothetical protein